MAEGECCRVMDGLLVHKTIDVFVESFKMKLLYHLFEHTRHGSRTNGYVHHFEIRIESERGRAFGLDCVTNFVSI